MNFFWKILVRLCFFLIIYEIIVAIDFLLNFSFKNDNHSEDVESVCRDNNNELYRPQIEKTQNYNKNKSYENQSNINLLRDINFLNYHPVYNKWISSFFPEKIPQKVQVILIVSSSPFRNNRRNAIRKTWWKNCHNMFIHLNINMKCFFFTELTKNSIINEEIITENQRFHDIIFQPIKPGILLGERLIFQMLWSIYYYDFEWLMKIDDDVFVNLELVMARLPTNIDPTKNHFIKGYVHCQEFMTRVDESFITISQFSVYTFINQPAYSLICHPLADQQIAIWVSKLKLKDIYHKDLHYTHPDLHEKNMNYLSRRLCVNSVIGIHAIHYVWDIKSMTILQSICQKRQDSNLFISGNIKIRKTKKCEYENKPFYWCEFYEPWIYRSEYCFENPSWNMNALLSPDDKTYKGRSGF